MGDGELTFGAVARLFLGAGGLLGWSILTHVKLTLVPSLSWWTVWAPLYVMLASLLWTYLAALGRWFVVDSWEVEEGRGMKASWGGMLMVAMLMFAGLMPLLLTGVTPLSVGLVLWPIHIVMGLTTVVLMVVLTIRTRRTYDQLTVEY